MLAMWPVPLEEFLLPQPQEAIHKFWLQSAQWLFRSLKLSYYESPDLNLLYSQMFMYC